MRHIAAVLVALVALLAPVRSHALFHITQIDEVMSGAAGNPNLQYVQIRMLAGAQTFVANSRLTFFSCSAGNPLTELLVVPSDLATGNAGGRWIMANLLGTPPPPPLPNVPALKDNTVSATLSVRERLAEHRVNAACASCHNLMDPIGFSLENFDAIGRWRTVEEGLPIDSTGGLPDGSKFTGVSGLEDGLLKRPDIFVSTLTEKLLTFALGRGVARRRRVVRHEPLYYFAVSSFLKANRVTVSP